ncbi:MAG: type II toxin-antitoxin system VapC family toxin [Candidatus Poribacteria bacterium]|nr:type II toxin-antitoxin system VapC family toxin [Candidatus Poribacteria bacterium]
MPTSFAVLDSGVLLATARTETLSEHAKALIARVNQHDVQIVAPMLLQYELIAVVRKWVYRTLITSEEAENALNELLAFPARYATDDSLMRRAYELATNLNRPTAYDAQYLAVAERFQCDFWTADERLFNATSERFPNIRWLGNVVFDDEVR